MSAQHHRVSLFDHRRVYRDERSRQNRPAVPTLELEMADTNLRRPGQQAQVEPNGLVGCHLHGRFERLGRRVWPECPVGDPTNVLAFVNPQDRLDIAHRRSVTDEP